MILKAIIQFTFSNILFLFWYKLYRPDSGTLAKIKTDCTFTWNGLQASVILPNSLTHLPSLLKLK